MPEGERSIYDITHPGWRDEEIARLRAKLNPRTLTNAELIELYDAVSQEITRRDIRENTV